MALIIFGSQAFGRRIQNDRQRDETRRLRSALTISLTALRKLYECNLGVLAGQGPPLISGRTQINLFRLHFGRLMSLDQPEIESLLTASISVEEAETAMALAGKTVGGVAFMLPEADEAKGTLKSALMRACSMLESAESLMTLAGKGSEHKSSKNQAAVQKDNPPRVVRSVRAQQRRASKLTPATPISALIEQLVSSRGSESAFDYGDRNCEAEARYSKG
jgi:hypothetical protein